MTTLSFVVDDALFTQEMRDTVDDLGKLIDDIAKDAAESLAEEGGQHSSRLGAPWEITGSGPDERHVQAPEFFAHFIAGGTSGHGPRAAQKLVFSANGNTVFADYVSGVPATHFDEAALAKTDSHLDEIMRRAIT